MPLRTANKLLLLQNSGIQFLVNGSWNPAITTAPKSGVFQAVDNLNISVFGTSTTIALHDADDDSVAYGIQVVAAGAVNIIEDGSTVASSVATLSLSTNYDIAIALDNNKIAHYFLYNSTQSAWQRIWVGTFATSASALYANDASVGSTYTTNKERFGTGMPYEDETVDIASPIVNNGSVSPGTDPAVPDANFVMQWVQTTFPTAVFTRMFIRYQDATNYWYVEGRASDSTWRLYEQINGSPTFRGGAVVTAANGDKIQVNLFGNTARIHVNSTREVLYTSANNFVRETDWTLNILGTGGAISSLKAWKAFCRVVSGSGSEVVTNGGFATDSDWTKGTGWTIAAGVASCDGSQVANSDLAQAGILTSGTLYRVTYTISNYSAGNLAVLGGTVQLANDAANGSYIRYIIANGTGFALRADLNFVGDVDNVSVKAVQFSQDILGQNLSRAVA